MPMPKPHRQGTVAVFISCNDRDTIDRLQVKIAKITGFKPTIKQVVSRAIADMAENL